MLLIEKEKFLMRKEENTCNYSPKYGLPHIIISGDIINFHVKSNDYREENKYFHLLFRKSLVSFE